MPLFTDSEKTLKYSGVIQIVNGKIYYRIDFNIILLSIVIIIYIIYMHIIFPIDHFDQTVHYIRTTFLLNYIN